MTKKNDRNFRQCVIKELLGYFDSTEINTICGKKTNDSKFVVACSVTVIHYETGIQASSEEEFVSSQHNKAIAVLRLIRKLRDHEQNSKIHS